MVIRVCPDCNPSSECRLSFLSGASETFLGRFLGFFHHTPSCCSLLHRYGCSLPPPALANQSLLIDVKRINTGAGVGKSPQTPDLNTERYLPGDDN